MYMNICSPFIYVSICCCTKYILKTCVKYYAPIQRLNSIRRFNSMYHNVRIRCAAAAQRNVATLTLN